MNRANRNFENYFVNRRYIKSKVISKAIEEGYASYMMQHRYPFCVLHITVPPESVDVNVHPTKMEVRFSDQNSLYKLIAENITDFFISAGDDSRCSSWTRKKKKRRIKKTTKDRCARAF